MPAQLYEYAVLHHEEATKPTEQPQSTMIVAVTSILAQDQQEAARSAARRIPREFNDRLNEIEVVVRPFVAEPRQAARFPANSLR